MKKRPISGNDVEAYLDGEYWKKMVLYDSGIGLDDIGGASFCAFCGKDEKYTVHRCKGEKVIKGKAFEYDMFEARCGECGGEMTVKNIDEYNEAEADRQYRLQENLVSVDDIRSLMAVYKLGKAPLSLALGFGEVTITRYLAGSLPSKEYSDIIRTALESPAFMLKKIDDNEVRLGDVAYRKAMNAARELAPISRMSDSLCMTISYLVKRLGEVSLGGLQGMLYFAQGIYIALFQKLLIKDEFQASSEGVMCGRAYDALKNFSFDLQNDERYSILKNRYSELSCRERRVIDAVVDVFGVYSGATVSKLAQRTAPWLSVAKGEAHEPNVKPSIDKKYLKRYFDDVHETFDLSGRDGIEAFLNELMCME